MSVHGVAYSIFIYLTNLSNNNDNLSVEVHKHFKRTDLRATTPPTNHRKVHWSVRLIILYEQCSLTTGIIY